MQGVGNESAALQMAWFKLIFLALPEFQNSMSGRYSRVRTGREKSVVKGEPHAFTVEK
jgi:hypothetical protein